MIYLLYVHYYMNYIPSHKFVISSYENGITAQKMRIEKAQNKCAHVCIFIFIKKDIRNRISYSFRVKIIVVNILFNFIVYLSVSNVLNRICTVGIKIFLVNAL